MTLLYPIKRSLAPLAMPSLPLLPSLPALLLACAMASLIWPTAASAQMFKDKSLDALYAAGRFAELDKVVAPRLAASASASAPDPEAVLARALSAVHDGDAGRRKAAIGLAEACVQRDTKAAACHYAHGLTLGLQSISEGMLKVVANVGRIRSSLTEALALEPAWFAARSAAVEFYLNAPGLAGGSVGKAGELARYAPKPEQQQALQARLLLHEDKPEAALKILNELHANHGSGDSALAADLRNWTVSAGAQLINNGQVDLARRVFERLQREQPLDAIAPYFLARGESETGQHEQALKLLAAAAALPGADRLPIDYRIGMAQQALGNKDAARAALNRYVNAGKGSKKSIEDAKKRLEQLAQG